MVSDAVQSKRLRSTEERRGARVRSRRVPRGTRRMAIGIAGSWAPPGARGARTIQNNRRQLSHRRLSAADKAVTGRATHLDAEPVAEDVVDVLRDGERVLAVQGVDVGHLLLKEGGKGRG